MTGMVLRARPENISGIYNFFYCVFRKPDNKNGCGLFPLRVKFYHAMLLSLILDAIKLIVIHWTHDLSSRWLRAYNEIWKSVQPTDYSYHSADNLTIWRFRAQSTNARFVFPRAMSNCVQCDGAFVVIFVKKIYNKTIIRLGFLCYPG